MPSQQNVLIFGPTGGVARAAALQAHTHGAHVHLAMRDPSKPIPGIPQSAQGYTRIRADLSQPSTLKAAVEQSGAKTAFVYTMLGAQDSMRSSFDALKAGGVTYVVLLSSWIVKGDPGNAENHMGFIDSVHAKTEIALRESGLGYAAVRPAYFNTNIFMYLSGIKAGKVDLFAPSARLDYIAPEDIGAVAAGILVNPPKSYELVYLCGPTIHTQAEAVGIIGKALGKEIMVNGVSEQEWKDGFKGAMPEAALESVAKEMRESAEGKENYPEDLYREATGNVLRWKGDKGVELGEWVAERKEQFV